MRDLLFLCTLLIFSAAGLLFPEEFSRLRGLIVPMLMVVMLSMGITLTPADFRRILRRPGTVLYGALLQFSVMPLSGYLIAGLFRLDVQLTVGVVLVGSAPGGTASNLITYIAGGDLPYSISMTTLSTLVAPLMTPLWTWLLVGKAVPVPFTDMALTTLRIVVLPVAVGMALRGLLREKILRVEKALPYLSITAISLIIAVIFALNRERFPALSAGIVGAVLLHNAIGFLMGFLLGRAAGLDSRLAKTLSVEVGMQNSGLATVLALKFFSPLAALPPAIFSLSQNLMGVVLSALFRRI